MKPPIVPVGALLRLLPDQLHAELLSRVLNHLLKGQAIASQISYLDGKRICIAITDTGNALVFEIRGNGLSHSQGHYGWDVRIAGTLADFWLLATRSEDPDTLFFQRRLCLEGDTDAGLYLKNLIDALEFDLDAHLEAVLGKRLAARIFSGLARSRRFLPERIVQHLP